MPNKKLDFKEDPRNARVHPSINAEAAERSLDELGAGRSIVVDSEGIVIGGNLVYKEAVKLGLPLRVIHTKGDKLVVVVRDDLATDDPKRKALALADNQISQLGTWDVPVLEQLKGEALKKVPLETMGFAVEDGAPPKKDGEDLSNGAETKNKCPKCGYQW